MKPVSKTAYYCCGVRMMDAASLKPIVNDTFAKTLMGEEGLQYWEVFKNQKNPNGSNVARCYLIDTWVKEQLSINPDTTVILIGAGLDSRAFRLSSGNWIELDEPGIIEYKNEKLPIAQCKNSLHRISIDFEKEKLSDKLAPFRTDSKVLIIIEGVLMYLKLEQKMELFRTITALFPKQILLCDLMNELFFTRLGNKGIYDELKKSGAEFQDLQKDPAQTILNFGYKLESMKSNVITATDFGLMTIPRFIVKFLMKKVMMGYASYRFTFGN